MTSPSSTSSSETANRAARSASALINTRQLPIGLSRIRSLSARARAYHQLKPYPLWNFRAWKTEDAGPLPRCLPIAQSVVKRGAKWLFGKPLELHCPDNPAFETLLRDAWEYNRMPARSVAMARSGGLDGGIALKFAYDGTDMARPLSIQTLSLIDRVRLFYDPHDRDRLLMARVQYPFAGPDGRAFWYREEWTAEEEVHYEPVALEDLKRADPDTYEAWEIAARTENPFGVIPIVHVKNLETDDLWGAGDLWDPDEDDDAGLYPILDRIHLTFAIMDRSNQFDSALNPFFIDLELEPDDIDKPVQPGEPIDLQSRQDGENRQGKVQFPPSGNALRPAMMEYAKELRKQVLEAASSVQVDQSEFTNKGNLTNAVLEQLYLPQIEITAEKRKSWGGGLCAFFAAIGAGLSRLGVDVGADYAVEVRWASYFELTQDEKAALVARIQEEEAGGYVPHEMAIEEVSQAEGRDPQTVQEKLAAQGPTPEQQQADLAVQRAEQEIKGLQSAGGPAAT